MEPTEKGEYKDLEGRIPEQALKQAEEADRIHREWIASMEAEISGPTGKTASQEEKVALATGQTGTTQVVVEDTKPSAYDELLKRVEKAEHKYDVLQGKYNAEVPEYALKLTQALNKVATLEHDLIVSKVTPQADPAAIKDDLEKDESIRWVKDEYPKVWDAVDVIIKKAAAETNVKLDKLKETINDAVAKTTENARDKFYDGLSDKVKGWEKINDTPEWKTWLRETDPYSGLTRQALISDAYNKMDVKRTSRFFSDYIEQSGLVKDKEPVKGAVIEPIKKKDDIAPNTTKTSKPVADTTTQNQPELIKSSEVKSYYVNLEKLGRMGQKIPEDMKVRGLQIDKAIMEGRVIP